MPLANNDTIIFSSNTHKNLVRMKVDLYCRRFKNGRWSAVHLGNDAIQAIDAGQLKYLALYRSGQGYGYIEEYAKIIGYEPLTNKQILHKYDETELITDIQTRRMLHRILLKDVTKLPHKVVMTNGKGGIQGCRYTTLEKLKTAENMSQI